jgi:hypothetical protein
MTAEERREFVRMARAPSTAIDPKSGNRGGSGSVSTPLSDGAAPSLAGPVRFGFERLLRASVVALRDGKALASRSKSPMNQCGLSFEEAQGRPEPTAPHTWPGPSVKDLFQPEARAPRRRLRAPCHWDGSRPGHPAASGAKASHCTCNSTPGPLRASSSVGGSFVALRACRLRTRRRLRTGPARPDCARESDPDTADPHWQILEGVYVRWRVGESK